eukprot:134310-Chlamydomonas_euryale.AAC.1
MLRRHFSPEAQAAWRAGRAPLRTSHVFVWLDMFAVNQHVSKPENWVEQVKQVVADADHVLVVLDQVGARSGADSVWMCGCVDVCTGGLGATPARWRSGVISAPCCCAAVAQVLHTLPATRPSPPRAPDIKASDTATGMPCLLSSHPLLHPPPF